MGLSHSYLSYWVGQGHKAWISLFLDHFRAVFAVSNLEGRGSISLCNKEHASLWIPCSVLPSRGTGPLCAQYPFGLTGSCSSGLGARETWLCGCWLRCQETESFISSPGVSWLRSTTLEQARLLSCEQGKIKSQACQYLTSHNGESLRWMAELSQRKITWFKGPAYDNRS